MISKTQLRDLHWLYPGWSAFLGAFGGWCCKWTRRYLLPVTGGLLAYLYGVQGWRCVLYVLSTAFAFALPYSPERLGWMAIALGGTVYGLTPLWLHWNWRHWWWPISMAVILPSLLYLSSLLSWFTHKIVELLIFGIHGVLVTLAIDSHKKDEEEN